MMDIVLSCAICFLAGMAMGWLVFIKYPVR